MKEVPVGAAIRAVRIHRKLTQRQVAERMKSQRSYVCKIEAGRAGISLLQAFRFAEAMEIEPYKLVRFMCKRQAESVA